jgi:hypothetical protein
MVTLGTINIMLAEMASTPSPATWEYLQYRPSPVIAHRADIEHGRRSVSPVTATMKYSGFIITTNIMISFFLSLSATSLSLYFCRETCETTIKIDELTQLD